MSTSMVAGEELAAGQVLVGGTEGTALSAATRARLESGRLGGLILMGRNVEDAHQVAAMLSSAAGAAPPGEPLPLLGVDQEGGRVARLRRDVIQLPAARSLGALGDVDLTRHAHRHLGLHLGALGFSVNFAPVLDVDGGPEGSIVGDRAFHGDPERAARHGAAAVQGLLEGGICPCGKHFPGHGCTRRDSHDELPRVDLDRAALEDHELPPFASAIAAGLPLIMSAHVVYEELDPLRPATCSESILRQLLRHRLGFDGVVITDDMTMGAVSAVGGPPEVAVEAVAAGVDLVLVCHQEDLQEQCRQALAKEARASGVFARRLEEAAGRSRALRRRFRPAPRSGAELDAVLDAAESGELVRELDRRIARR